jgi:hypothetical protein
MGSPIRFEDFKRKFAFHEIHVEKASRGSHYKLVGYIDGIRVVYPFAVHKNRVKYVYVKEARKRFKLTPAHGVTDADFNSR